MKPCDNEEKRQESLKIARAENLSRAFFFLESQEELFAGLNGLPTYNLKALIDHIQLVLEKRVLNDSNL